MAEVHILHRGKTLCGAFFGVSTKDWPDGHKFVRLGEPAAFPSSGDVMCINCEGVAEAQP